MDVVCSEFLCGSKIPLTKRRSSTAAAIFRERNLKPQRFQHFHCGDSDVRFVIAHECVVPEDDRAASGERGRPARCFWRLAKKWGARSGAAARCCAAWGVTRGA